jgi:hypothetical protein
VRARGRAAGGGSRDSRGGSWGRGSRAARCCPCPPLALALALLPLPLACLCPQPLPPVHCPCLACGRGRSRGRSRRGLGEGGRGQGRGREPGVSSTSATNNAKRGTFGTIALVGTVVRCVLLYCGAVRAPDSFRWARCTTRCAPPAACCLCMCPVCLFFPCVRVSRVSVFPVCPCVPFVNTKRSAKRFWKLLVLERWVGLDLVDVIVRDRVGTSSSTLGRTLGPHSVAFSMRPSAPL